MRGGVWTPERRAAAAERARKLSADPEVVAKRSATNRIKAADPVYRRRQSEIQQARLRVRMADPAFVEMLREQGRRVGRHNLANGLTMEARAKAAPKIRAKALAWRPEEYWDLNAKLKASGFLLPERKAMIAELVEKAPARAVAAIDRKMRERERKRQRDAY